MVDVGVVIIIIVDCCAFVADVAIYVILDVVLNAVLDVFLGLVVVLDAVVDYGILLVVALGVDIVNCAVVLFLQEALLWVVNIRRFLLPRGTSVRRALT